MKLAAIGECMLELSRAENNLYSMGFGGDTLNTAVYLARCGGNVDYVTALGDDPMSEKMLASWQGENIGTRLVHQKPGAVPGMYMIETDDEGERSFYYWRGEAPARTLFEDAPETFQALKDFDYIYLSGITLSLYSDPTLQALFSMLDDYRSGGGLVAFDLNYRPRGWPDEARARRVFGEMIKRSDVSLPSYDDECLLDNSLSKEACIANYKTAGVKEVVLKAGTEGCWLLHDNEVTHVPLSKTFKAVDTTAAGDSFNGAYLAARLQGLPPVEAIAAGQACAGLVVQHRGAIIDKNVFKQHGVLNVNN